MKTRQEIESIARQKKRIRLMLIYAAIFLVLAGVATALLVYFLNQETPAPETAQKPEIIEGEGYYRNYAIAYPQVSEKDITRITVRNVDEDGKSREYMILRANYDPRTEKYTEDKSADYLFTYLENGEIKVYYPSILSLESSYKYSDLYAKETGDGYGTINKLTYLLAALEIPYFGERIPLSEDAAEREKQLRIYGFSKEDPVQTITFDYSVQISGAETADDTSDDKYETRTRTVKIGDKVLSGTGYYFRLTDPDGKEREYIYNSNSNYYDYALMGFYSFVNGRLIAEGIEGDSSLEPTLVKDFTHWKNELYKEGEVFGDDSRVVVISDMTVPLNPYTVAKNPEKYEGLFGYDKTEQADSMLIDLGASFSAEKNALIGNAVGKYADGALEYTLVSATTGSALLSFDYDGDVVYNYTITEIESIVDMKNENGTRSDCTVEGTVVGANSLIKVAYSFDINGQHEKTYDFTSHAVIDLKNPAIPKAALKSLRAASVGELSEPIEFSIRYNKENSTHTNEKIIITEIISVKDQDGNTIKKINENSIIEFKYKEVVATTHNGKTVTTSSESGAVAVNLKTDESETGKKIKELLIGRQAQREIEIEISSTDSYYEAFNSFVTYGIKEIEYFVTQEEVISLSYQRYFERDPFFGESIYENNTDGYELYGIEATNCENIIRILGGAATGDSTSSAGITGETIDIGITPEKLEKYGLYEHTVYFELPRGIYEIPTENEDDPLDYDSYSSLGTTLYISKEDSDGNRIVASDTFDVIAKIDGENFEFLEESFVDFWARENLILTSVENMQSIKLEFKMEDLVGNYDFKINHSLKYVTYDENGRTQLVSSAKDYIDTYNLITVLVRANGECTENELTKMGGTGYKSLTALYNQKFGNGKDNVFVENGYDYLGTNCFKDVMRSLFFVQYEDSVDESEQEAALSEGEQVMKITFSIIGKSGSLENYAYEFYRFDDRRVLVRLCEVSDSSKPLEGKMEVSDFYVSTFAFKKIVGLFNTLLNGEIVDLESTFY